MGRKLQTIYEYFGDYSEDEINKVINYLSDEERNLIICRYGNNLHNPFPMDEWSRDNSKKFYGCLIPKMKKLLENNKVEEVKDIKEETVKQTNVLTVDRPKIEVVDYNSKLIELLNNNKNSKEICDSLNISSQQLYEELLKLKNKGIMHSKKYYSDGTIRYNSISNTQELKTCKNVSQEKTIITEPSENNMRFLLISDLHFGNDLERIDLIDRAFEYCIKNDINIILCGGDLIDGSFTRGTQKISDLYKQVEYFIKNYPHDDSILTFSVAGDHDISAFSNASIDIIESCNNYRHDVIIGGYNNSIINVKNDKIQLFHHIESGTLFHTSSPIVLHGHSHKYSTELRNNGLNITIPTLSEINQPMPTALELNVNFNKGHITNSIVRQIYFGNDDIVLGEAIFDLSRKRKFNNDYIYNTEEYKHESEGELEQGLVKTLRNTECLSQIEKFNRRYGNNWS